MGYSTVRVVGEAGHVEMAKLRITAALQKVGGTTLVAAQTAATASSIPSSPVAATGGSFLGGANAGAMAAVAAAAAAAAAAAPGVAACPTPMTGIRTWGSAASNGPASPAPLAGGSMQVQIDQRWIGWLLGRGGTVVKEIEAAAGGAKVSINQDTKALGYSVATITGHQQQISLAYDQIGEKLRRVNPSGDGLVPLMAATNGSEPSSLGTVLPAVGGGQQFTTSSSPDEWALANPASFTSDALGLQQQLQQVAAAGTGELQAMELQIEQKWVGWLLGSQGKTVREIESETGCKITIDQTHKDLGFSAVRVSGNSAGVALAQQRIQASLSLVVPGGISSMGSITAPAIELAVAPTLAAPPAPAFCEPAPRVWAEAAAAASAVAGLTAPHQQHQQQQQQVQQQEVLQQQLQGPQQFAGTPIEGEMQVEQKWIGWLLGKAGIVLKEIELQSGASVKIDQSTKELGFSTLRIIGDWQQSATARQLIQDKIAQAHPGGPRLI